MSIARVSRDEILESIQSGPGNTLGGAATTQNEGAWPRDTTELTRLIHAGKLALRQETEGTGVVSSLAIIRKHIAELESTQVDTFTRGLGSLLEYLSSNHFRSGVVLSQNSKILDWLAKAFKDNPAFLPGPSPIILGVLKLIAWIAATMKYNNAAEKKIKELIYPSTFQLVENLLEYKSRSSPAGRNNRMVLSIREEDDDDEIEERFCEIEEIDNWFGFGIYTLMIMEKFLALPGAEIPSSLPERLLDLLVFFCQHFPSVAVSEVRTTILNSINSLMKAVIPKIDRVIAAHRIGDLMMISLVFQQKTDFVYSLQTYIEEVIVQEPEASRLELQTLLNDERTLRRKVLKNCTKLRSLLFSYLIFTKSSPELARWFFNRGGRAIYMQMLYDCIKQNKVPKIYIFLKDDEVLQHTTKREEQMLLEITNRINDSAVKYQLVEELSLFTRTIINRRLAGESHQSEYTTFSKVFKEKETAEVVMNGLVSNFWKEGKGDQPENKNLVIEVKQNSKRKALEVDLTSPGAGSAKSFNSWFSQQSDSAKQPTSTEALPEDLDAQDPAVEPLEATGASLVVPHVVNGEVSTELGQRERQKQFKATLYSYDIRRELGSKDVKSLRETFFSYDRRSNKMKLFKGKTEVRVVYHRRLVNKRGLYFGVFEIDDSNSDYMYLDGIVYSPIMRRIFVTVPIKRFQRNQQGGTPYYEQDFVTLCTTTTPEGARDHLIVLIDKSGSKYKLLYNSLQLRRKAAKEFPHFESIFTSWSVNLDSYRSFSLASGNDHVLIGCKHLLAVFQATHGELAFKHVIADTGFGISRIRLLDYQTNTFILFGYASREFNIVNIAAKKIYNFIFEWLQASQAITEVELDKNLMVYLVEDRKRRKSSVFFREETQHLPTGPPVAAAEGAMEETAEAPRLPLSTIFSKGPEPDA